MKILVAVAGLKLGGTERVVSFVANGLAARGHETVLLTRSSPEHDFYSVDAAVKRVWLPVAHGSLQKSARFFTRIRTALHRQSLFRQVVKDVKPDIILSFSDHINVRMLLSVVGLGIPVVVSERNNPTAKPLRFLHGHIRRLLYPKAAAFVSPSRALLAFFPYVPEGSRYVIPNPVREVSPEPVELSILGLSSQRRYIFAMGRLARQKGFDILLQAFADCSAEFPGVDLVILGEGDERTTLTGMTETLQLSGRVRMPGAVKNPHSWLQHAELFVLSSRFEGFPNALLEAMGLGLASIATDCPTGPGEIIENGQNGLLVPVNDPKALAAALRTVLSDATVREQLGRNAVYARDRFSEDTILDHWEALIKKIGT